MTKIVISDQDIETAASGLVDLGKQRVRSIPSAWRWGLFISAFVLPILCIACAAALIALRNESVEMRARLARYCCVLLIVSGLVTSLFAVAVYSLAGKNPPWEGIRGRMQVLENNLERENLCQV